VTTSPTRILSSVLLAAYCAAAGLAQQQPPERSAPPPRPPLPTVRRAPPPLPKIPDVRQPGERGFWVGLYGWFPTQAPVIDKGKAATFDNATKTTFQGRPKYAEGFEAGIAVGLHNSLHLSYFEDRAAGTFTNTTALRLWNQDYDAGNLVSTNYRLQNAKIMFEYLSWPYPVESRRFRFNTLWGVQYTSLKSGFDLPLLPLTDSAGNAITDAGGNPVDYATKGSHWLMLPSLGVQAKEYLTRSVRLEASASGFAIPHHAVNWDADASANFRTGHFEFRVGVKAFHFKTSTQQEFYFKGTQVSGFAGLRWYSN
jgi:hypothetical protein